jgi:hypothetical protein
MIYFFYPPIFHINLVLGALRTPTGHLSGQSLMKQFALRVITLCIWTWRTSAVVMFDKQNVLSLYSVLRNTPYKYSYGVRSTYLDLTTIVTLAPDRDSEPQPLLSALLQSKL